MQIYRLCKEIYSSDVLQGRGGLESAGRWHSQGRRIVYCASSEALAVLELRVHLGPYVPRSRYVMHAIDVPDELIADLTEQSLPADWNRVPHTLTSQAIGDEWLRSERSLALQVPSIHSQTDRNILLNPLLRGAERITVIGRRRYRFDHRLFGARAPQTK